MGLCNSANPFILLSLYYFNIEIFNYYMYNILYNRGIIMTINNQTWITPDQALSQVEKLFGAPEVCRASPLMPDLANIVIEYAGASVPYTMTNWHMITRHTSALVPPVPGNLVSIVSAPCLLNDKNKEPKKIVDTHTLILVPKDFMGWATALFNTANGNAKPFGQTILQADLSLLVTNDMQLSPSRWVLATGVLEIGKPEALWNQKLETLKASGDYRIAHPKEGYTAYSTDWLVRGKKGLPDKGGYASISVSPTIETQIKPHLTIRCEKGVRQNLPYVDSSRDDRQSIGVIFTRNV